MRELDIFWCGKVVGHLNAPESIRPPMTRAEMDVFGSLLFQSRSFLFDIRAGDLRLEEKDGSLVVIASDRLGAGDVGCLRGFTPAPGCKSFVNEEMIELAASILRDHQGKK